MNERRSKTNNPSSQPASNSTSITKSQNIVSRNGKTLRGNISQSSVLRGSMLQNSMSRGSVQLDSMSQDSESQNGISQNNMPLGSMSQDSMSRDNVSRGSTSQDMMSRVSPSQNSMSQGSMLRDSLMHNSLARGSTTQDSISYASTLQDSISYASTLQDSISYASTLQDSNEGDSEYRGIVPTENNDKVLNQQEVNWNTHIIQRKTDNVSVSTNKLTDNNKPTEFHSQMPNVLARPVNGKHHPPIDYRVAVLDADSSSAVPHVQLNNNNKLQPPKSKQQESAETMDNDLLANETVGLSLIAARKLANDELQVQLKASLQNVTINSKPKTHGSVSSSSSSSGNANFITEHHLSLGTHVIMNKSRAIDDSPNSIHRDVINGREKEDVSGEQSAAGAARMTDDDEKHNFGKDKHILNTSISNLETVPQGSDKNSKNSLTEQKVKHNFENLQGYDLKEHEVGKLQKLRSEYGKEDIDRKYSRDDDIRKMVPVDKTESVTNNLLQDIHSSSAHSDSSLVNIDDEKQSSPVETQPFDKDAKNYSVSPPSRHSDDDASDSLRYSSQCNSEISCLRPTATHEITTDKRATNVINVTNDNTVTNVINIINETMLLSTEASTEDVTSHHIKNSMNRNTSSVTLPSNNVATASIHDVVTVPNNDVEITLNNGLGTVSVYDVVTVPSNEDIRYNDVSNFPKSFITFVTTLGYEGIEPIIYNKPNDVRYTVADITTRKLITVENIYNEIIADVSNNKNTNDVSNNKNIDDVSNTKNIDDVSNTKNIDDVSNTKNIDDVSNTKNTAGAAINENDIVSNVTHNVIGLISTASIADSSRGSILRDSSLFPANLFNNQLSNLKSMNTINNLSSNGLTPFLNNTTNFTMVLDEISYYTKNLTSHDRSMSTPNQNLTNHDRSMSTPNQNLTNHDRSMSTPNQNFAVVLGSYSAHITANCQHKCFNIII